MKRSTEFSATAKHGVRATQPDIVVHALRTSSANSDRGPKIGLVIGKSVGSSVQRHRVARRLRHVARNVVEELSADDRVVIRALASSRHAMSARLEQELRAALKRAQLLTGAGR